MINEPKTIASQVVQLQNGEVLRIYTVFWVFAEFGLKIHKTTN